jgi:S1-C subfamily serine protease
VVERVGPGVVTIRSERRLRAPRQHPFFNRDFFGELFGGAAPAAPRVLQGLGSGVIVRPDGYILTNHVIDGAQDINVEFVDHRTVPAKVVGSDPPSDLALLKVEVSDLTALPFAAPT